MRRFISGFSLISCFAVMSCPAHADGRLTIPLYVEETQNAGIDSVYAGDWEYMVGGGAATFDCNDDGYPDLFLSGGEASSKFYRNTSGQGGSLTFAAAVSGLELDKVSGAYPFDADGDGITDLVLLRVGENVLMRGKGACLFERANEEWGFDGGDAWSTAFSATWERGNDWPTIAVGNYIDRFEDLTPWGSCTDNWLQRPAADARRFAPPKALTPSYCPLSILFTDWNRSGTPDLRVSNDREYYKGGQEQLWRMEPGKDPVLYTAAEGWKYLRIWGMGIASYDLDFDGYPEYFLSSMADNKLQTLTDTKAAEMPSYGDVAFARGATAHRPYTGGETKPSTGWHTQFEDVNNDGLADLFIAKGNVAEMPDFALKDPNNLLIQKPDGTFQEAGGEAGVAGLQTSRGAAMADFNLDGLIDLVVVNRWKTAQLWRNTSRTDDHWVSLRLKQDGANREAIGSWVEVRRGGITMRREITVGGGHASGQSGWQHFGLGDAAEAELRVIWPDGEAGAWMPVTGDAFHVIERGKAPVRWMPGASATAQ